jgi:hypothetical protein
MTRYSPAFPVGMPDLRFFFFATSAISLMAFAGAPPDRSPRRFYLQFDCPNMYHGRKPTLIVSFDRK